MGMGIGGGGGGQKARTGPDRETDGRGQTNGQTDKHTRQNLYILTTRAAAI